MSLLLLFNGSSGAGPGPDLSAVIRFVNEAASAARAVAENLTHAATTLETIRSGGTGGESIT